MIQGPWVHTSFWVVRGFQESTCFRNTGDLSTTLPSPIHMTILSYLCSECSGGLHDFSTSPQGGDGWCSPFVGKKTGARRLWLSCQQLHPRDLAAEGPSGPVCFRERRCKEFQWNGHFLLNKWDSRNWTRNHIHALKLPVYAWVTITNAGKAGRSEQTASEHHALQGDRVGWYQPSHIQVPHLLLSQTYLKNVTMTSYLRNANKNPVCRVKVIN
jgi:hypothetical protein